MSRLATPVGDDFVLEYDLAPGVLHIVRLAGARSGSGVDYLYVQKVARHWRVCAWSVGPALEGLEHFASLEEAVEGAKGRIKARMAAVALGADEVG